MQGLDTSIPYSTIKFGANSEGQAADLDAGTLGGSSPDHIAGSASSSPGLSSSSPDHTGGDIRVICPAGGGGGGWEG